MGSAENISSEKFELYCDGENVYLMERNRTILGDITDIYNITFGQPERVFKTRKFLSYDYCVDNGKLYMDYAKAPLFYMLADGRGRQCRDISSKRIYFTHETPVSEAFDHDQYYLTVHRIIVKHQFTPTGQHDVGVQNYSIYELEIDAFSGREVRYTPASPYDAFVTPSYIYSIDDQGDYIIYDFNQETEYRIDSTILFTDEGDSRYLEGILYGDCLYYIDGQALTVYDLKAGNRADVLCDVLSPYLYLTGEDLYFTDASGHLASLNTTTGKVTAYATEIKKWREFVVSEDYVYIVADTDWSKHKNRYTIVTEKIEPGTIDVFDEQVVE